MDVLDRNGLSYLIGKIKQEISAGGSAGVPVVTVGGTQPTAVLSPGKHYVFGSCETLTVTLAAPLYGLVNEYSFEFDSGATATVLSLPDDVVLQTSHQNLAKLSHYIVRIAWNQHAGKYYGTLAAWEMAPFQRLVAGYAGMKAGDILLNDLTWVTQEDYKSGVTGICVVPAGHMPDRLPRIMGIRQLNEEGKAEEGYTVTESSSIGKSGLLHCPVIPTDKSSMYVVDELYAVATSNVRILTNYPTISSYYRKQLGDYYYYDNGTFRIATFPYSENGVDRNEELWDYLLGPGNMVEYDGPGVTDYLVNTFGTGAIAATTCRKYKTTNMNAGDWYEPCYVEMLYLSARRAELDAALAKVKGTAIGSESIWLANRISFRQSYSFTYSYVYIVPSTATSAYSIRPFFDLKKVLMRQL